MFYTVPMLDGAMHVHVCVCTCVTVPTCWSGLAQSVIQVRPTGSGLMRIGSALSGSQPGVEGVCGAQGEKRNTVKHTSSPSWETARDAVKHSENSDLSRHNDKAQCSGFLWGAVGHRYTNLKRNQSTHSGYPVRTLFFSSGLQKAVSFSFLLCLCIQALNRAAVLGKHVSKSC